MMSRGCPAPPECNSTFFPPSWLILQSRVAGFEMRVLTLEIFAGMQVFSFVIATICINAYTQKDFPLQECTMAHHKRIFCGHITLKVNISAHCRLPPHCILVNSTTESTFSENEFFLPWCRLLLWGECKLLRRVEFNMHVTCSEACAYV